MRCTSCCFSFLSILKLADDKCIFSRKITNILTNFSGKLRLFWFFSWFRKNRLHFWILRRKIQKDFQKNRPEQVFRQKSYLPYGERRIFSSLGVKSVPWRGLKMVDFWWMLLLKCKGFLLRCCLPVKKGCGGVTTGKSTFPAFPQLELGRQLHLSKITFWNLSNPAIVGRLDS